MRNTIAKAMMEEFVLDDQGAREEFDSGAVRDVRTGKGRFDLISPVALWRIAEVYEKGAEKYTARNWEQGMPFSRLLDSALRHLNDYSLICLYKREGKNLNQLPKTVNPNEDHLAQAAWNIIALLHFDEVRWDLDDLSQERGV